MVLSARMYLRHAQNDRLVVVQAGRKDRPYQQCSIGIVTSVALAGNWSDMDIRCGAASNDEPGRWDIPMMRGRGAVPLERLADALKKTLEEQEQVLAAMKTGVGGPYRFSETCWE